jgi:hypothetical protein
MVPSEMRLMPAMARSAMVKPGSGHDIDRLADRRTHGADGLDIAQPRRVKHIGAGLLEGLQPLDRVVEIRLAPQEILGSAR